MNGFRTATRFAAITLAAALALLALAARATTIPPHPNILFVLADDLGINDLHCYGRTDHRTPNLDRLAAAGVRFTAAYCAQPICSPSRAAILTGKAPARLRLTTFLPGRPDCAAQQLLHPAIRQQLPLQERTLAEEFRAAGYATACIGKWHLGGTGFLPTDQGFDSYHPGRAVTTPSPSEGGKGEYDLTEAALRFIEAHRSRPFLVYLAHNSPHVPFSARTNLVAANRGALEPDYAATIQTLDDTVGRLLDRLDALGLGTNTLVVFTSDNGGLHVPEGGHRTVTHNLPFRAGKGFLYEGGLRVPAILRWPGVVPAGRTIAEPVVNTGWLPTLLELAGLTVPAGLDGTSFAALATGHPAPAPGPLFWHFPHYTNQGSRPAGAIRDGEWKLIEHYEDGRVELFNLTDDSAEAVDLSDRERARARAMREQLTAWRLAVGAQTNPPNPAFDPALHRKLYADIDVSHYNAARADRALVERLQVWRQEMNAVLPQSRSPTR